MKEIFLLFGFFSYPKRSIYEPLLSARPFCETIATKILPPFPVSITFSFGEAIPASCFFFSSVSYCLFRLFWVSLVFDWSLGSDWVFALPFLLLFCFFLLLGECTPTFFFFEISTVCGLNMNNMNTHINTPLHWPCYFSWLLYPVPYYAINLSKEQTWLPDFRPALIDYFLDFGKETPLLFYPVTQPPAPGESTSNPELMVFLGSHPIKTGYFPF